LILKQLAGVQSTKLFVCGQQLSGFDTVLNQ
jgi:hypothetical protein